MARRRPELHQELVRESEKLLPAMSDNDTQAIETWTKDLRLEEKPNFDWKDSELGFTFTKAAHIDQVDAQDQVVAYENDTIDVEQTSANAKPPGVLEIGHLSPYDQTFCSLYKLLNFSYLRAIKKDLPQGLRQDFIDKDILWNRHWDLYYIWSSSSVEPIFVLPECQFRDFMQDISSWFPDIDLCNYWTYQKYRDIELLIDFPEQPRFTPRYLGPCRSREEFKMLSHRVPSKDFRTADEPDELPIEQDDIDIFDAITRGQIRLQLELKGQSTIDMLPKSQLQRKSDMIAEKKKQKKEKQLQKRREAADMFKRAQQYLGMRAITDSKDSEQRLDPNQAVPHSVSDATVFVCFDVESWERDHSIITEIGLAILPLSELVKQPVPGTIAANWHSLIQAQHFRIIEHSSFRNMDFVQGNPYGFKFGTSQEISIEHASMMIEELFDSLSTPTTSSAADKIKIVLVGHALQGDIRYLEKLGFDATKHANVIDTLDTQTLWHVLNSLNAESNNAGLAKVLTALELSYNGLHNAGNDAVYTMRAMLGMMVLEGTLRAGKA